jgi:coenzyme PQQ biosynthesis protein PqqD
MHVLDPEMLPRHRSKIVAQQAAGKTVLLDLEGGGYYALDDVSGRIWQLCDGTRSVRQIVEAVRDEYDTADQEIEEDVIAFVSDLVVESLLV